MCVCVCTFVSMSDVGTCVCLEWSKFIFGWCKHQKAIRVWLGKIPLRQDRLKAGSSFPDENPPKCIPSTHFTPIC